MNHFKKFNQLSENLQNKINFKIEKDYVKKNIHTKIIEDYMEKKIHEIISVYKNRYDETEYIYYLALFEADILYYMNNKTCFRTQFEEVLSTFLSKCLKKKVYDYISYKKIRDVYFDFQLINILLDHFSINQLEDFLDMIKMKY